MASAQHETSFMVAVEASCPSLAAPNFFGAYFSFDGVHPSSEGNGVIAGVLAEVLNAKHGV